MQHAGRAWHLGQLMPAGSTTCSGSAGCTAFWLGASVTSTTEPEPVAYPYLRVTLVNAPVVVLAR